MKKNKKIKRMHKAKRELPRKAPASVTGKESNKKIVSYVQTIDMRTGTLLLLS